MFLDVGWTCRHRCRFSRDQESELRSIWTIRKDPHSDPLSIMLTQVNIVEIYKYPVVHMGITGGLPRKLSSRCLSLGVLSWLLLLCWGSWLEKLIRRSPPWSKCLSESAERTQQSGWVKPCWTPTAAPSAKAWDHQAAPQKVTRHLYLLPQLYMESFPPCVCELQRCIIYFRVSKVQSQHFLF